VVHEVDPGAELLLEVERLQASRARLAAAADDERRRIERDLHDGVQQHLVALAVNVQLVRQLADTDPEAAAAVLEQIGADVREALESVRAMAHRIYPPLLLDRGLVEALRAAAARADIRTRVEAGPLERYPVELEASVYFCCIETLERLAACGDGVRANVRVWAEGNALQFEIDSDATDFLGGDGIVNVADRLGALGGQLLLESDRGRGIRVSGSIPVTP